MRAIRRKRHKNSDLNVNQAIIAMVSAGPVPSSVIYRRLKDSRIPSGQARTAVSRLIRKGALRQYKLVLGSGNRILTVSKPVPDAALLRSLYDNDFFGRPSLKSLIECLGTSHQIVSAFDIAKIATLNVGAAPGNWSETFSVIDALQEIGVLIEQRGRESIWAVNRKTLLDSGIPFGIMNLNLAYFSIRNRIRYDLNVAVTEWLRKNTFLSDAGAKISSATTPVVSLYGVPFDVVGFCFSRGIARRRKKLVEYSVEGEPAVPLKRRDITPSPFVGDCLIEECNLAYASSFVRRVREADAVKGKRAPVAFVFARRFTHEAFMFLREEGVLTWTHSQLLGIKTAEAIQRILSISENIVAQQNLNPQLFTEIFEGFENFQGLFGQLKGKLFELLMAYFHQRRFQETRLAWQIDGSDVGDSAPQSVASQAPSQQFDVDVTSFQDGEAFLVECKGIKIEGQVEESEVSKHFTRRLPLARRILLGEKSRPVHKFRGLVITTGTFDEDTMKKFNSGEYKPRTDTTFELWDRTRLLDELRQADQSELISIVDRYYQ